MNYSVEEVAKITNAKIIGDKNLKISNISFDSRNIYSSFETAFLAINTNKNSGEKYISSAIDRGVKIIISEKKTPDLQNVTWIIVNNSLTFLQQLAKYHVEHHPLKTIGITGSNGKTIVKEWLYQCLWQEYPTVKSPKSFNSQLGLPISLLHIEDKHEIGIFEVGISKPGEMDVLEAVFSPEIGILTHIGSAHSINFSSEKELINEKIKLFKNSKIIIFNGDNELVYNKIKDLYPNKKLISYGFKKHNDFQISIDLNAKENNAVVSFNQEFFTFHVRKKDESTVINALCIITVLKFLQFSDEEIIDKLNTVKAVEMRLESVEGIRNNLIINDSYNLDLDSLIIAYQSLKEYNKKKKVLILTDVLDVREKPHIIYPEIVKITNEQGFDKIFLIGQEIINFKDFFSSQVYTFNKVKEVLDFPEFHSIEDSLILLKGARKFEIEEIKNALESQNHDTVLEVNLNNIIHNINVHKSLLNPETKMMAMVKAYSYGLGGYEIAEFLQHHHIDYLGVAYIDEGIELRKKGITTPIMVMNPEQNSFGSIIDYNLEPEIYNFRVLEAFQEQLISKGIDENYPIHLKIETGMHRLGFQEDEVNELIERLNKINVKIASIFSHLSSSDDANEKEYTLSQLKIFETISQKIMNAIEERPLRHILNTSGISNYIDYQYDMVRIGIGMVGISSNASVKKLLKNAVCLKTVISQISSIEKGESVGYNRKYKANHPTKIATLPVGYADGIPRSIGNEIGKVGIKGQLFPIVGNICMDMMMINIENLEINEGDEVIIFNENPSLEMFSTYCNTIPYEVLTSISRRVKRIYIKD